MNKQQLYEMTGIAFPLGDGDYVIDVDDTALDSVDWAKVRSLIPEDCKARARRLSISDQTVRYDTMAGMLELFPGLDSFYIFDCSYDDPSFYRAFKGRCLSKMQLILFENDESCFELFDNQPDLACLEIVNLNSSDGLDQVTSPLKRLTIHAPDLTMDRCLRFKGLEKLDIFSKSLDPSVDYPKLVEFPDLRALTMPVYGDDFKHFPDLPMLEQFTFHTYPFVLESEACLLPENIQYSAGDFADFPMLEGLKELKLSDNNISFESLDRILSGTPNLRKLTIMNNRLLTEDDFMCIGRLKELEKCSLIRTKIRASTVKKLTQELPNCEFKV